MVLQRRVGSGQPPVRLLRALRSNRRSAAAVKSGGDERLGARKEDKGRKRRLLQGKEERKGSKDKRGRSKARKRVEKVGALRKRERA